ARVEDPGDHDPHRHREQDQKIERVLQDVDAPRRRTISQSVGEEEQRKMNEAEQRGHGDARPDGTPPPLQPGGYERHPGALLLDGYQDRNHDEIEKVARDDLQWVLQDRVERAAASGQEARQQEQDWRAGESKEIPLRPRAKVDIVA